VQFLAQANGSPTPALQWQKDGVAIGGATDQQLLLSGVQSGDAGTYTVVASNSVSMISTAAVLTVGEKPRLLITEMEPSGSGENGQPVSIPARSI
jgi:hypothetical protein